MNFLLGLLVGAVGMFILYGNNKKKMNALYAKLKAANEIIDILTVKEEMRKEKKID